jgi:hypothetical protein
MRAAQSIQPAAKFTDLLDEISPTVMAAVAECVAQTAVPERDLTTRLLLHLPRMSGHELHVPRNVFREAFRLAERLLLVRDRHCEWVSHPKIEQLTRQEVTFRACEEPIAQEIYRGFHYIGSVRDGAHFGLFHRTDEIPMAMVTASPLDVKYLERAIEAPAQTALMVSRVYAFDWAPRNSISCLLSQFVNWVRACRPAVKCLLTYVNPNLGFTGAAFRASNWRPFTTHATTYLYLDEDYISHRTYCSLAPAEKLRVTESQFELKPLDVYILNL